MKPKEAARKESKSIILLKVRAVQRRRRRREWFKGKKIEILFVVEWQGIRRR